MWHVYILECDNKIYYVGMTDNIKRRVNQHINKQSFYTKQFFNIRLVYVEQYKYRKEAEKREAQLKKWSVAKKKALIIGDIDRLKKLSNGSEFIE